MSVAVIVGGSSGLGRVIAERLARKGEQVIVTSRTRARAEQVAAEIGHGAQGLGVDLSQPATIADAFSGVSSVDHLVITAIEQGANSLQAFDIDHAVKSLTIKLVGYAETVRVVRQRFTPGASAVLFGGVARDRPYPGSTMVTTFNGGVTALVRTLAIEIAPHRVNAVHPGVVGDSPKWRTVANHPAVARTPIGRLVTMDEVADATEFLLRNTGVNAQNLVVDGGLLVT